MNDIVTKFLTYSESESIRSRASAGKQKLFYEIFPNKSLSINGLPVLGLGKFSTLFKATIQLFFRWSNTESKHAATWNGEFHRQYDNKLDDNVQTNDSASSEYMSVVSSQIEIDAKYQNQTCGLCGNFDGISNDFIKDGKIFFKIIDNQVNCYVMFRIF